MDALDPTDAGVALAAILDDLGLPAAAWIARQGHRAGAEAILADCAAALEISHVETELLRGAVHTWGLGDDEHAAGAALAYSELQRPGGVS